MTNPANHSILRTVTRPVKVSSQTHVRLNQCFSHLRKLYNEALADRKFWYETEKKSVSFYDQCKILTQARKKHECFSQWALRVQRSILQRLDRAYKTFFRKGGFPRFKGKNRGVRSFEVSQVPKIRRKNKWSCVSIKGIGQFRFRSPLPDGEIKLVRVVKTARRMKLQFVMELKQEIQPDSREPVGVDVGISNHITLSTGQQEPKRELDRKELKQKQRRLSKSKKGSQNRRKKLHIFQKEWQRVTEREKGYLHELTRNLVKTVSSKFVVEDLQIQNMLKNKHLARSISEQNWGTFVNYLTYKAESAGGWVQKVDSKYTSQLCSACGQKPEKKIGLHVRKYKCQFCGHTEDRDVNAAKNILLRGLTASHMGGRPIASGGRLKNTRVVKLVSARNSVAYAT